MTSIDNEGETEAQRLDRMRSEFLVAQQRRRGKAAVAPSRPDDTDDGPLLAGPPAGGLIAAVRQMLP